MHELEAEAAKYRLLDKTEVYPLFETIENGLETFARLGSSTEHANEDDVRALLGSTAAFAVLFHTNLRLPLNVVRKKYGNRYGDTPFFQDIAIDSLDALSKAVQLFDYRKGFAFSTYAVTVINHQTRRYITDHFRSLRLPTNAEKDHGDIIKASAVLTTKLKRAPTSAEIAEATDMKEAKVVELQLAASHTIPLDKKDASSNEGRTIGDKLVDNRTPDAYRIAEQHALADAVDEAFTNADLTLEEKIVLSLRYKIHSSALADNPSLPEYQQQFEAAAGCKDGIKYADLAVVVGVAAGLDAKMIEKSGLGKLSTIGNLRAFSDAPTI